MANSKSWPKEGDKYFFVSDDVYSDAYAQQTARHLAGNFFRTLEEAKEMADKAYELFNF